MGINLNNIIIISGIIIILFFKAKRLKINVSFTMLTMLYILFLIFIISCIIAPDKSYAISRLFRLIMIIIFCLFVSNIFKASEDIERYSRVIVIILFITSIYCIVQKILGISEYYLDYGVTNTKRITGTFSEPNVLASYIIILIPFLLLYIKKNKGIKQAFCIIVLFMNIYVVYFTYSRWALISLLVGYIITRGLIILKNKEKINITYKKIKKIFAGIGTSLCILFIYSDQIQSIIKSFLSKRYSTGYRLESTILAIKISFNNMFGVGLGNTNNMILDGSYTNLIMQSGILSLIIYIIIISSIFMNLNKKSENNNIYIYCIMSFIIFVVNSIGENIVFNTNTNTFLGLYIAIAFISSKNREDELKAA